MKLEKNIIFGGAAVLGTGVISSVLTAIIVTKSNKKNYEVAVKSKEDATRIFNRIVEEKEEIKKISKNIKQYWVEIMDEREEIMNAQNEVIDKFKETNKEMVDELKVAAKDVLDSAVKEAMEEIHKQNEIAKLEEDSDSGKKGSNKK